MIPLQPSTIQTVLTWYNSLYAVLPLIIVVLTIVSFVWISRRRQDDGSPMVLLHCGVWSTVAGLAGFIFAAGTLSQDLTTAVIENIEENITVDHVIVHDIQLDDDALTVDAEVQVPKYQVLTYIGRDGVPQQFHYTADTGSLNIAETMSPPHERTTPEQVDVRFTMKYEENFGILVPERGQAAYPIHVRTNSPLEQYFQDIP